MKSSFSGLLGYTEVLKVGADSMTHQEISDYSDNLHKHSQNSFNLLENLLNWSMLQTGRMDFIPIKFDLYQEIQFVLDLVEANALSKNINISNDVKEFTFVRADENMLRTVLYNLVTNAIKFTFKGGEVKISSDEKDGFIIISVSNNGVIISEEDIGKLFKLTTKIKTEGTSKEKGTGLGLLICKEMIDKHNGKITVESSEDKGTTFCVWLPV
jgi:signal transduction histidine kinase